MLRGGCRDLIPALVSEEKKKRKEQIPRKIQHLDLQKGNCLLAERQLLQKVVLETPCAARTHSRALPSDNTINTTFFLFFPTSAVPAGVKTPTGYGFECKEPGR